MCIQRINLRVAVTEAWKLQFTIGYSDCTDHQSCVGGVEHVLVPDIRFPVGSSESPRCKGVRANERLLAFNKGGAWGWG